MPLKMRSDVRAIADAQSARIDAQMGQLRAELRQEHAGLGAELLRWMFLFRVGTMGTVLALLKL